jgi:indole-3-glycerol phosphate synthase
MSQDFLATMAASSQARVAEARRMQSDADLWRWAEASPPPPPLYLSLEGFDVIAEVKMSSPAVGKLRDSDAEDVVARVTGYAAAGAAAVSVLTEPERFDGSLDHLEQASRALLDTGRVPAMRKDFLVDAYQVAEARLAGAGGILIIVRMLDRPALDSLLKAARHFGLFVLIEAFDAADIHIARELVEAHGGGPQLLIGINSRDLKSLKVVPGRLEELVELLPRGVPRVAESGVSTPEDAARLARAGYELALIGSALMTTTDPTALLKSMISAGRRAR